MNAICSSLQFARCIGAEVQQQQLLNCCCTLCTSLHEIHEFLKHPTFILAYGNSKIAVGRYSEIL